jgi:hypothetical protein
MTYEVMFSTISHFSVIYDNTIKTNIIFKKMIN